MNFDSQILFNYSIRLYFGKFTLTCTTLTGVRSKIVMNVQKDKYKHVLVLVLVFVKWPLKFWVFWLRTNILRTHELLYMVKPMCVNFDHYSISSAGAIGGAVVAGLILIIVLCIAACCCCACSPFSKKKREERSSDKKKKDKKKSSSSKGGFFSRSSKKW